jgi:3-carboxy-cis,cis-muconate cycloisomerase
MTTFAPIFVPAVLREATSDAAWLEAMLDAERALALAEARLGVIPADAADSVAASCRAELFDIAELAERGRGAGNPVEPLVRALRERVGGEAADFVHWGATSQDILDSAAMLVSRRTVELILAELDGVATAAANLAEEHARTPMVARTLLQQAVPTTFGYKAATWLTAVLDARAALATVRDGRLAAQLGGAAGTLAAFGDNGIALVEAFANELQLASPLAPWHSDRSRIAELGAALELAAGSVSKIALDVALLAQTEGGEAREGNGGVSSTMPQKRNPSRSAVTIACARGVGAAASLLRGGIAHEHERAVGGWHVEWSALSDALALTGGAAASAREVLGGLELDTERMRGNLDASDGLVMAERLSFLLAEKLGRQDAQRLVADAAARARDGGRPFRAELLADARMSLSPSELDAALDPVAYLGSAPALVASILARYRASLSETGGAR